eukprot:COSAG03_NODE_2436_length_2770_cov_3.439536_3_plen_282_part_00
MLAELAAAAGAPAAVSTGAGGAGGVDQAPLPRWVDSSEGVHEFLTMDIAYKGQDAAIKAAAARFDFIWGSSVPGAWRNVSSAVVPSLYTPYAWDGGWGGNLTWWQTNHPDWVLYKCDRTTPAYWNMIKANVPFDMSNRAAVQFHYDQIRRSFAPGYKAVAADMFYLENTANACGESTALSPAPLIFSHNTEKSLWRRGLEDADELVGKRVCGAAVGAVVLRSKRRRSAVGGSADPMGPALSFAAPRPRAAVVADTKLQLAWTQLERYATAAAARGSRWDSR